MAANSVLVRSTAQLSSSSPTARPVREVRGASSPVMCRGHRSSTSSWSVRQWGALSENWNARISGRKCRPRGPFQVRVRPPDLVVHTPVARQPQRNQRRSPSPVCRAGLNSVLSENSNAGISGNGCRLRGRFRVPVSRPRPSFAHRWPGSRSETNVDHLLPTAEQDSTRRSSSSPLVEAEQPAESHLPMHSPCCPRTRTRAFPGTDAE
jgi:hypothetical protein